MGDVYIRELKSEDWKALKDIRIRALKLHRNYFSERLEDAEQLPDSKWKDILNGDGKRVFGLYDNENLVGISGIFTDREDKSGQTAVLGMTFIEPNYRGHGYSHLFYKNRFEFAKQYLQWMKIKTCHRRGNDSSQSVIKKNGFVFVKQQETDWPDGTRDIEYCYELDLEKIR